ncbi:hypothetical protein SAMD00019534_048760 [Acytostelium subglobosum LB1]|uniref:hypothetical protein n=1 Tax=Acytostelium subglobosum LB1 TaxID=1410327 RepID=UPI0006449526|nr:hypothetical protein SAMD00019534_048760 [Acytostelium subglobosum LB1]GAM21701.1 hypothetical protein SAMD00019534_048760 [Acytostelium subglobosum LB1]|eukprot:XP_012755820.1 hypothetical protein SAMD00019534_048760 [Acytostelium subglobosum LB1]
MVELEVVLALSSLISFVSGVLVGKYLVGNQQQQQHQNDKKTSQTSTSDDEEETDSDSDNDNIEYNEKIGPCKMVLVVRTDLEMTKGKIAAQCCHGTLGAYKRATRSAQLKPLVDQWELNGQAKVTVKVNNEKELLDLESLAKQMKVPHYLVVDAGRTQIASGSCTVLAIGPAPLAVFEKLTGHLKLL